MSLLQPQLLFARIARDIPAELHQHLFVAGSLAAAGGANGEMSAVFRYPANEKGQACRPRRQHGPPPRPRQRHRAARGRSPQSLYCGLASIAKPLSHGLVASVTFSRGCGLEGACSFGLSPVLTATPSTTRSPGLEITSS